MQYRHEFKHYLNYTDYLVVRARLRAIMRPDGHIAKDGSYQIRSLYFDNASDKALREKQDGVSRREKFRIRCYDFNYDFIRLEKKVKQGGLGYKLSVPLDKGEVKRLLHGNHAWMRDSGRGLVVELYEKMKLQGMRPKTIVDYTREPFVYPAGNVRVTLDYDIRTGVCATDLLDKDLPTISVCPGMVILEVKYDNFLPDVIRDIVQMRYRDEGAFSKYGECRKFS